MPTTNTKNIGKYRHRIEIQQPTITKGDAGGIKHDWSKYLDAWAQVEPGGGREYWEARGSHSRVTGVIKLRYRDGVTPKMRVIHKGRILHIEHIENELEKDKELHLYYREDGDEVDAEESENNS